MKQDAETTLAELKEKIQSFARERDWEQFHHPKNLSMAIAAEAAELMEHFLWTKEGEDHAVLKDPQKGLEVREELADIVIYAMEFANIAHIDLAESITLKMAANARKYPVEKSRGRSAKYTEL